MVYLWVSPDNLANKHIAEYNSNISPSRYLFYKGTPLTHQEVSNCYCYYRSNVIDLSDDPFIRFNIRKLLQRAYIFTPTELYYSSVVCKKININLDELQKFKEALSLTDKDLDSDPKILTDYQLQLLSTLKSHPMFCRLPILQVEVTKTEITKFDSIHNSTVNIPLINQKIINILQSLAPHDVQFFDAELHCSDGILTDYKILNITHAVKGIDHEKSIYGKISNTDAITNLKYVTYLPNCMGKHKLARDAEYTNHLLVTEEIKQAFEQAKIKGVSFVKPENYY